MLAGLLIQGSWSSSQGPSLRSITPEYSRKKKHQTNKKLRNKWFKTAVEWLEQSKRCTKDLLQAGGAFTQLRPEPHQVCQYFVINRSEFSQFEAPAGTPCLFWVLTARPTQAGVHKSRLAVAAQQGPPLPPHQVPRPSTKLLLPTLPVTDWAGRGPG